MDQHLIIEEEKKDRGFTLVELLIVIVILGILATVTVFAVRGITERGEGNACKTDKKTVETAIEAWYALPTTGTGSRNDALGSVAGHPSESELVASNLMREPSTKVDVSEGPSAGPPAVAYSTVTGPGTATGSCTTAQFS